jgi:hypothetical protein
VQGARNTAVSTVSDKQKPGMYAGLHQEDVAGLDLAVAMSLLSNGLNDMPSTLVVPLFVVWSTN